MGMGKTFLLQFGGVLFVWIAIALPVEIIFGHKSLKNLISKIFRKSWQLDFLYAGLNISLHTFFLYFLASKIQPLNLFPTTLHPALQALIALFVFDVIQYFVHRWYHRNWKIMRFHAIHHSSTTMDFLVSYRFHLVDGLVYFITHLIMITVLLNSFHATLTYLVLMGIGLFAHVKAYVRVGWLRYIFITPMFHHWHHCPKKGDFVNFAAYFPFLDAIFGTFYFPDHFPEEYGQNTVELKEEFIDQLLVHNKEF